jgi:hypothetical protein
MVIAIDLDDHACIDAREVGKEGAYRHLATELATENLPFSQLMPQPSLCLRHLIAKLARAPSARGAFRPFGSHRATVAVLGCERNPAC